MLGVRESYTSRGVLEGEKMTFDSDSRVGPSGGAWEEVELGRKLNLSRGEVLSQLGEKRCFLFETGNTKIEEQEVDSTTFVKDSVLDAKARASADMLVRLGDPCKSTGDLINTLAALKNSVVTGTDDFILAGYAEACVSVLLKHLDRTVMDKISLEEVVTNHLLLDVSAVAKLFSADPMMRVAQHKVQVLLGAEVHLVLDSQAKQQKYEISMLAHLRQISLHGGRRVMSEFLSIVLTECYVDRQPELLSLLYDELDEELPKKLTKSFSPTVSQPPSTGPASNLSTRSSNLGRSFRVKPKSFDTSLNRQINNGAGSKERKNLKVVTTFRMMTKPELSAKKKHIFHESPRKTNNMVKRNLTFDDVEDRSPFLPDKLPRKQLSVTTPSKARKFTPHKSKSSPGNQHKVLCPETPIHKVVRRKSDGNFSIAGTPDKGEREGARTINNPRRQRGSLALYSGVVSRNVHKFEDSLETGNMANFERKSSMLDERNARRDSIDSTESGLNRSFLLFPHLLNRKRKMDNNEHQAKTRVLIVDPTTPVKMVKRSLDSFSDSPSSNHTFTSQTFTNHATTYLDHHMDWLDLELTNFKNVIKTQPVCDYDVNDIDKKLEFAGNSSDSEESKECAELEFAGNSSDLEECLNFVKDSNKISEISFAGDEDSSDSFDLYEPTLEEEEKECFEFNAESVEEPIVPFKSIDRPVTVSDPDFTEPLEFGRPLTRICGRFCKNDCQNLVNINFQSEIRNMKSKLELMKNHEKRNYILEQLKYQDQFGLPVDRFVVKSEHLCTNYFSHVTGVSCKVLHSVLQDFCFGVQQYTHGKTNTKNQTTKMLRFTSWLMSFSRLYGEHSPEEAGVIVLPSHLTKAKLYIIYSETVRTDLLAHSTFYLALGTKFGRNRTDLSLPCVLIPKDSLHCKCNECLSLKKFKRNAKTELQLSVADELLKNHFNVCGKERMNVWTKFQRCVDFPDENLGIQFDDMDQTKTNLPRFSERSKSQSNFCQLKTHLTGVIVHSGLYESKRCVHFYLNNDQFEQGGSKSVSIIQDVLKNHQTKHGFLPPNLHLSADNCWRECKNIYLFSYLVALVTVGVFQEITMSYMIVGHTHDEVDQLFSIVAQFLKGRDVSSLENLVQYLEDAPILPRPNVHILYHISDWKKFILPRLTKEELSHHSGYHSFKISLEKPKSSSEKPKVCFRAKVLSTDKEWVPKLGIQLIQDDQNLENEVLEASPFRFQKLKLADVFKDVSSKYIPLLPADKAIETQLQWKALEQTFIELEKQRHKLKTVRLNDLFKFTRPKPPDHSKLALKDHSNVPEIWGKVYSEDLQDGDFLCDAKIGLNVIIYTVSRSSRPWVGVITDIAKDENKLNIHWYKRAPGGGKRYRPVMRGDVPYTSTIDVASVMLWSVADHLVTGELDLSDCWDKINEEYNKHDDCYQ